MKVSNSSVGFVLFFGAFIMASMDSLAQAYTFYVGGRDGWVLNPAESYSHWAERNRFQVNDTLVFKYKKGEDSVLVVKKEDYDACSVTSPIEKLDGGDSTFRFDRSGPFYFISGVPAKCSQGQKLIIVVLAVRNSPPSSPTTPPAPPHASQPPSKPPVASPPSSPSANSPFSSPSKSPASTPASPPTTISPVSSPLKSPATSPVSAPSSAKSQSSQTASGAVALSSSMATLGLVALILSRAFVN